jgi:hypothetical protein
MVIANNDMKGGLLYKTGEVFLINTIEYIPISAEVGTTFEKFIED